MAFHVRDPATDRAVRRLAKVKGKTLTDTIGKQSSMNMSAAVPKFR